MKRIFIFLLAVSPLAFVGCGNSQGKSDKSDDKLTNAVNNAEQSQIVETDLFLGFKFRMTEQEKANKSMSDF